MKKFIVWFFVIFSCTFVGYSFMSAEGTTGGTASTSPVISPDICTQEYAPVCGQPKMQDCAKGMACAQIIPAPKTYSNTCILKGDGAEFLYTGECKDTTITCPQVLIPTVKEGCTVTSYTDETGCKKLKQVCEQNVCSKESNPVCGGKETCSPNDTTSSNSCTTVQKTFTNKCFMNNAQYKFISVGECKAPEPVCPVYDVAPAPEGCYYKNEKNEKGCEVPKLVCKPIEPVCPILSLAKPPEGCAYEYEINEAGCKKPKLVCKEIPTNYVCKFGGTKSEGWYTPEGKLYKYADCTKDEPSVCPVYNLQEPKEGCTYEYEVNEAGCKKPKLVCKDKPVCRDFSTVKLMREMNGCPLTWYTDTNGCKAYKYECKKDTGNDALKKKIEVALIVLFKKLDASSLSNADKVTKLQTIVEKLKALIQTKPQFAEVLNFAIDTVNTQIASYQDDGSGDIFQILQ